jgi:hypothetical protein
MHAAGVAMVSLLSTKEAQAAEVEQREGYYNDGTSTFKVGPHGSLQQVSRYSPPASKLSSSLPSPLSPLTRMQTKTVKISNLSTFAKADQKNAFRARAEASIKKVRAMLRRNPRDTISLTHPLTHAHSRSHSLRHIHPLSLSLSRFPLLTHRSSWFLRMLPR